MYIKKYQIKVVVILLLILFGLSTNIFAGTSSGAFVQRIMFNQADFNSFDTCQDNAQQDSDGSQLTRVALHRDGSTLPTNLGTGEYDKYLIYKPKNVRVLILSGQTNQSNFTFSQLLTRANHATVAEYVAIEAPTTSGGIGLTGQLIFEKNDSKFATEENTYYYLGIPANEPVEAMRMSNILVNYYISGSTCAELATGVYDPAEVVVTDGVIISSPQDEATTYPKNLIVSRSATSPSSKIELSWDSAAIEDIGGYQLAYVKKSADGNQKTIESGKQFAATILSYTAENLEANTMYDFYLYAYNNTNNTVAAAGTTVSVRTITTDLAPTTFPENLSAKTDTSDPTSKIVLSWTPTQANDLAAYQIAYQSQVSGVTTTVEGITVGSDKSTYTAENLSPGTKYTFWVSAITSTGSVGNAASVIARTLDASISSTGIIMSKDLSFHINRLKLDGSTKVYGADFIYDERNIISETPFKREGENYIYFKVDMNSVYEVDEADVDGDGYTNETDCNDNNATVHPDAPEIDGANQDLNCQLSN